MRLFIALEPSRAFRDALAELQARLRASGVEGRYLDADGLHMTLAFIGEWQADAMPPLPAVRESFPLALSSLGEFRRAKVLWAGVRPSRELEALASTVRTRLEKANVPYDHQGFTPHITLVRKPLLPREDMLSGIEIPPAVMTVREVCLYRSEHTAGGMRYTVIGRSRK